MLGYWKLDDVDWGAFDASKVDTETLKAVKAAAMVEFNSADYVGYLNKVFHDDPDMLEGIAQWGIEEAQHGEALGRWAEMADPSFDFKVAFQRFKDGYTINEGADQSVRGSRAGEMIARSVVESGTSSFYSGMRDNTDEPVLKQIAAFIAADEFRHWKLFHMAYLKYQPQEKLSFPRRLGIALTRVQEAEDDELAFAYYCGNVPAEEEQARPYDRDTYSKAYNKQTLRFYHWRHLRKGVRMIAKAIGLKPRGIVAESIARIVWWAMKSRTKNAKPA